MCKLLEHYVTGGKVRVSFKRLNAVNIDVINKTYAFFLHDML